MTDRNRTRRQVLRLSSVTVATSVAGCSGGGGGNGTTTTDGPFPPGSCLAAATATLPDPSYGFEFSAGADPEVGNADATAEGDVTVADGTVAFGENGGQVVVEGVTPVDDLTVSLFARPAVVPTDQWDVMLWYSPVDHHWAGWGVEHREGTVDFWAEGPDEQSTEVLATSPTGLTASEWAHVVGVKRENRLSLYLDGEEAATAEFPHEISYAGEESVTMALGRHAGSGAGDRHYRGTLDSVAVWDGALSSDEVNDLLSMGADCR